MSLRDKAITEYHQMLAADAGLSAGIFENLRAAMRSKLLVYGDRPIGVALRPHYFWSASSLNCWRRERNLSPAPSRRSQPPQWNLPR